MVSPNPNQHPKPQHRAGLRPPLEGFSPLSLGSRALSNLPGCAGAFQSHTLAVLKIAVPAQTLALASSGRGLTSLVLLFFSIGEREIRED